MNYEVDAFSSVAGTAVPMVVTTAGLEAVPTTPPLYPQGQSFSVVGSVSYTFIGPVLAGLAGNSITTPAVSITGFALAPDSNGTVTGTAIIPDENVAKLTITPAATVTGASWSTTPVASVVGVENPSWTNVCVITAGANAFNPGDIGDGLTPASSFQGLAINDVTSDGTTAVLNTCPKASSSGSVSLYGSQTLTQIISTPLGPFTANAGVAWSGNHATTADLELAAASAGSIGFSLGPIGAGSDDSTPSASLITGYTGGFAPGPGITAGGVISCSATPALPPPVSTSLQSTGCSLATPTATDEPHDAVSVPLADAAPTVTSPLVNLGVGLSTTVSLGATPSSVLGSISSFQLLANQCPTPTVNGNTLQCSLVGNQLHLNDATQTGVAMFTIQYTATDNLGVVSAAGTVTVTVGTPPVDQPLTQVVQPGQLVLSCNAPGSVGYAETTCPNIDLPQITLNGLAQTKHAPLSTIYVSDDRGDPTVGWSLSTYMVATGSNSGEGGACSTYVGFCASLDAQGNPTTGVYNTANGKIPATDLSVSGVALAAFAGNNNTAPAGSGGTYGGSNIGLATAAAGFSGGTFTVDGTFNLVIPSSVYAATYLGTVEYLVQ